MSTEEQLARLTRAVQSMVWAQERLPALVDAGSAADVLQLLVDEAVELTDAPSAWALVWTDEVGSTFRALAASGDAEVPAPYEISRTLVGKVVESGRPAWSDDASADARFQAAESVQALSVRSVGCVPIGTAGVLYLLDPDQPGRFEVDARLQLTSLCKLAAPFVQPGRPQGTRRRASRPVPGMVGDSPAMHEVYATVRAFAPMPWPALILGETGTGKELVARAMHDLSSRAREPFVAVNCGAIPSELAESTLFGHERGSFTGADRRHEGLVERVRGGTLFLDEVGELPPPMQVKLLRLLQEKTYERVGGERALPFRGRVLAATLRDLDGDDRGGFRDDLYHRLAACVIRVPPLRDRRGDIGELAQHLLERALEDLDGVPSLELSPAALAELKGRAWPGNVRELENAMRGGIAHALASGATTIGVDHLRGPGGPKGDGDDVDVSGITSLQDATEAFQKRVVYAALEACDGNRTATAERLDVSRQWLYRLLNRWEEG